MDKLDLYGGTQPWDTSLWETTDDRVRGGASHSYLVVINPERAQFCGNLDISTLGGAGFASQNSVGTLSLDLSAYDGIVVKVIKSDGKRYILTLKDEIPGRRKDGRKESGISWEANFSAAAHSEGLQDVFVPWSDFEATYRGREKPDAKPLHLANIKRVSLMMRSFFGKQEGDFSIDLHSISAARKSPSGAVKTTQVTQAANRISGESQTDGSELGLEKPTGSVQLQKKSKWWKSLLCCVI